MEEERRLPAIDVFADVEVGGFFEEEFFEWLQIELQLRGVGSWELEVFFEFRVALSHGFDSRCVDGGNAIGA